MLPMTQARQITVLRGVFASRASVYVFRLESVSRLSSMGSGNSMDFTTSGHRLVNDPLLWCQTVVCPDLQLRTGGGGSCWIIEHKATGGLVL